MLTRREVLIRCGGVAALPLLPHAALGEALRIDAAAPASPVPPGPALYRVIVDRRFPLSCAFGAAVARCGVPVQTIAGDVTDAWHRDLAPAWRRQPVPIAGLTAEGAIFCLERLAWDVGMRVTLRGVHTPHVAGGWAHEFEGPEPVLDWLRRALQGTPDWVEELSRAAAQSTAPGAATRARVARLATPSLPTRFDQWCDDRRVIPLVSWVIAPCRVSFVGASA